ncbi:MAG TPA: glycosyltransferase family A protein [Methylocystis sp.]|nr:glycosyltransferase family A protein [Methylocystis sp.]
MVFSGETILSMPRIASIATMPTRLEGFEQALNSMLPQVDHVFVYLDNFQSVPVFLNGNPKISTFRMEELGNLHASSRFLALSRLEKPSILLLFDDDIIYPPDHASTLASVLAEAHGRALVGVHGRVFMPPHVSYIRDALCFHLRAELRQHAHVHELGAGTCAFISSLFDFDVTRWSHNDMDDILLSIEAQKRSIPRVAVRRPAGWLRAQAENQPDSLWEKTKRDDRVQSEQMRFLLKLY